MGGAGVARRRAREYIRSEADREFEEAHLESVELPCRKPGQWIYYVGFKPSQRPTADGARRLCEGVPGVTEACPLFQTGACKAIAHNLPPGVADGVWGGQLWIDGKLIAD